MSRTRKKFPWEMNSIFRCPKGKKKALQNNVRKRAIPPDAWDDLNYDKQCMLPMTIAKKLINKGWDGHKIIDHLVKNYGVTRKTAREVTELEFLIWK